MDNDNQNQPDPVGPVRENVLTSFGELVDEIVTVSNFTADSEMQPITAPTVVTEVLH